jgi:hypothetical protein
MLDKQMIADAFCHEKGCDDIKIAACKAASGAVKELVYCTIDRCFYVTVDGRERLRSDSTTTAYTYFASAAPE